MEYSKLETSVVEEVVAVATEGQIEELSAIQLALVGGGIGDIVAA